MTAAAIRAGLLVRQPCELCGDPKSHAHHPNYRRPLKIRWLCRRHHLEVHGRGEVLLTYRGETLPVKEWAIRYGVNRITLLGRIKRNWPTELALRLKGHSKSSPFRVRLGNMVRAARECLEHLREKDDAYAS
jgi:hypothetical protein